MLCALLCYLVVGYGELKVRTRSRMHRNVQVLGSYLYTGTGGVFDISGAHPVLVGGPVGDRPQQDFVIEGGVGYELVDYELRVVTMEDRVRPRVGAVLYNDDSATATRFDVGSGIVCVRGFSSLVVIDARDYPVPPAVEVPLSEGIRQIHMSGSVAHCVLQNAIQTVDVSLPHAPTIIGTYNVKAGHTAVQGSMMYLTIGSELQVVDFSTHSSPVVVGTYTAGGVPSHVWVSGTLACVVVPTGVIELLDISDPHHPTRITQTEPIPTVYQPGFVLVGERLYLVERSLLVFDVSTMSATTPPALLGVFDPFADDPIVLHAAGNGLVYMSQPRFGSLIVSAYSVGTDGVSQLSSCRVENQHDSSSAAFSASHGYIVGEQREGDVLTVVSADSGSLSVVGQLSGELGDQLVLDGDRVYMLRGPSRVEEESVITVVSVADVTQPTLSRRYTRAQSNITALGADKGVAYFGMSQASGSGLFVVANLIAAEGPQELGELSFEGAIGAIAVSGSHVFASVAGHGVAVIDVHIPESPVLIKMLLVRELSEASTIYVAGTRLHVSGTPTIGTIDVSNLSAPVLLAVTKVYPEKTKSSAVFTETLVYIPIAQGVTAYDVSSVDSSFVLSQVSRTNVAQYVSLAVSGTDVYAATADGSVMVFDASGGLAHVGSYEADPGHVALAADGDLLFVASGGKLNIVSVSDKTAPRLLGTCSAMWANKVIVQSGVAYLLGTTLGVVDVADPRSPAVVANLTVGMHPFIPPSFGNELRDGVILEGTLYAGSRGAIYTLEVGGTWGDGTILPPQYGEPWIASAALAVSRGVVLASMSKLMALNGSLEVVGEADLGTVHAIAVSGSLAYMAATQQDYPGLLIVDATNPAEIIQVERFNRTMTQAVGAIGDDKILTMTETNLAVLRRDGSTGGVHASLDAIRGHYMDGNGILYTVGVAGLLLHSEGILLGRLDIPSDDVIVAGHHAYVASPSQGLIIIDVGDASTPVQVGSHHAAATKYYGSGSMRLSMSAWPVLYVRARGVGVFAYDVSAPTSPVLQYHHRDTQVDVENDHILTSGGGVVHFVTSTTIHSIGVTGALRVAEYRGCQAGVHRRIVAPSSFTSHDGLFYLTCKSLEGDQLIILDPVDLRQVGRLAIGTTLTGTSDVFISQGHAYLASAAGVMVVDIGDVANPQYIGSYVGGGEEGYHVPAVCKVTVREDKVVVTSSGGMRVFTLSARGNENTTTPTADDVDVDPPHDPPQALVDDDGEGVNIVLVCGLAAAGTMVVVVAAFIFIHVRRGSHGGGGDRSAPDEPCELGEAPQPSGASEK